MGAINTELRCTTFPEAHIRMVEGKARTIRGYGIVFNKESHVLYSGGRSFREVIRPEAMNGIDLSRVQCMHNHKSDRLLGAAYSGTMRTGVDSTGVWYEVDLPEGPTGEDVLQSVRRGDTVDSSFQFTYAANGATWSQRDGMPYCEITQFDGVYEMGPVTNGAYPDTTVSARSLEAIKGMNVRDDGEDGGMGEGAQMPAQIMTDQDTLGYMMDNVAWATYYGNDMIYAMNNWANTYDRYAKADNDQSAVFAGLAEACRAAKEAMRQLINLHADAIKSINNSPKRDKNTENTPENTQKREQSVENGMTDAQKAGIKLKILRASLSNK